MRRSMSTLRCALALVSLLLAPVDAIAQRPKPPLVTNRGDGPPTVVLVSGIVGGVAAYRRLEAALLESGTRVITIDPYGLSLDSADVTFDALARRVKARLAGLAVDSAVVVG